MIAYVTVGNSDDKLSQHRWAQLIASVDAVLAGALLTPEEKAQIERHGRWFSAPDVVWQNATWCIEMPNGMVEQVAAMKAQLRELAGKFDQDSIVWAPVVGVEFLQAVLEQARPKLRLVDVLQDQPVNLEPDPLLSEPRPDGRPEHHQV